MRQSKLRCRYRTDELLMSEMRIRLRSPGEEVPKEEEHYVLQSMEEVMETKENASKRNKCINNQHCTKLAFVMCYKM